MSMKRKAVYVLTCDGTDCGKSVVVMSKRKIGEELGEKGWSYKDDKVLCPDCQKK